MDRDEGDRMDWRMLSCASCGHPVAQGRCPACRAARDDFRRQQQTTSRHLLIALAAVMVMLALLAALPH
jgi:uncharacterized membrane protein YvbJ